MNEHTDPVIKILYVLLTAITVACIIYIMT